jgi:hypothetical protein
VICRTGRLLGGAAVAPFLPKARLNTLLLQTLNHGENPFPGFRPETAMDQFAHVLVVHIGHVFIRRRHHIDASSGKYVGIEAPIHGEARSEQPD